MTEIETKIREGISKLPERFGVVELKAAFPFLRTFPAPRVRHEMSPLLNDGTLLPGARGMYKRPASAT
jgi:hypothetical protein